ncbi:MAG: hypothetical protein M1816_006827 [Peltula sp. TS41687]|nr:MAG: hypothetical protein M1816_006827 [Peltula sp. TS41687]
MCRPYLLIPRLPEFADADWTTMRIISRSSSSSGSPLLEPTISYNALPTVKATWHPQRIEVLSAVLKETTTEQHRPNQQHPDEGAPIAPAFLGHLTENGGGRVVGFLLEKVEGEFASKDDLPECEEALRRPHRMGLVHGDVNRYNFLVDRRSNTTGSGSSSTTTTVQVRMVDFEHAEPFDETLASLELESLASQLSEESGRGGPAVEIRR